MTDMSQSRVESLRRRVQLSTVASELTVRRLMWLRASLPLAVGKRDLSLLHCLVLASSLPMRSTCVRAFRPHVFLHIIFKDLSRVLPSFTGFKTHWKQDFLRVPVDRIQQLRTCIASESNSASVVAPAVAAEQVVEDVENHPAPEELQQLMCDICGDGPWKNTRARRGHKISKHGSRNAVQTTTCPICHREFTSKSAAQRHVKKHSCLKAVQNMQNHGHAGAVAGIRIAEAAARAAAHAAAKTKAQTASQPATARSRGTQAPLRRYFGTHRHAGVGLSSGSREPCRFTALEAQSTRSRAPEGIGGTAGSRAQPTDAEDVSNLSHSRSQPSRVGSLVNSDLVARSEQRAREAFDGLHGFLEAESTTGAASSRRPGQAHRRSSSGEMGARQS